MQKKFKIIKGVEGTVKIGMYSPSHLPTGIYAMRIFQWVLQEGWLRLQENGNSAKALKIMLPSDPVEAYREIMKDNRKRGCNIRKQLKEFVSQLARMASTNFYAETTSATRRGYRTILPIQEISLWNDHLHPDKWNVVENGRPSFNLIVSRQNNRYYIVLSEDFVKNVLIRSGDIRRGMFAVDNRMLVQLKTINQMYLYKILCEHLFVAQKRKSKSSVILWEDIIGKNFYDSDPKSALTQRQRKFKLRKDAEFICEKWNTTYSNLSHTINVEFLNTGISVSGDPPPAADLSRFPPRHLSSTPPSQLFFAPSSENE